MGQRQGSLAPLGLTRTLLQHNAAAAPAAGRPAVRLAKVAVGFAITAVFVWLLLSTLSLQDVGRALAAADFVLLPVALLCLALGYAARMTRWWLMLRPADPTLPWWRAGAPFLMSIAVNNVAPLRAGDVLRLFAFRGHPTIGPARVLGTVVVERVLDLSALLAVFFLVLPLVPNGQVPEALIRAASLAAGVGALAGVGLILLPGLGRKVLARIAALDAARRSGGLMRLIEFAGTLIDSVSSLGRGRRLVEILALTAVAWALEGGVFVAAAAALGVSGGAPAGYFALATATLATLLPSSPGYVGTFHFFAAQAVVAFGTPAGIAGAFAVAAHLVLWGATTVAGLLAFLTTLASGRARAAPEVPGHRPAPATKGSGHG